MEKESLTGKTIKIKEIGIVLVKYWFLIILKFVLLIQSNNSNLIIKKDFYPTKLQK